MAYEKPEVLVLSFAASAVRSGDTAPDSAGQGKGAHVQEANSDGNDATSGSEGGTTSSTATAYEADE